MSNTKTEWKAGPDRQMQVAKARREREKQERMQSIIQAAMKVFFSKGYMRATMDDIALEAEITKPTIYNYFKTKDELFFSLMLPTIEEIGRQLSKEEEDLDGGAIKTGKELLDRMFQAFYLSYEKSPDIFRIIQLFQQQGMIVELDPEIREALNNKGRYNFDIGRRILRKGMDMDLIKEGNEFTLADLLWGTIVGIIQLENIKGDNNRGDIWKHSAIKLARRTIVYYWAVNEKSD